MDLAFFSILSIADFRHHQGRDLGLSYHLIGNVSREELFEAAFYPAHHQNAPRGFLGYPQKLSAWIPLKDDLLNGNLNPLSQILYVPRGLGAFFQRLSKEAVFNALEGGVSM